MEQNRRTESRFKKWYAKQKNDSEGYRKLMEHRSKQYLRKKLKLQSMSAEEKAKNREKEREKKRKQREKAKLRQVVVPDESVDIEGTVEPIAQVQVIPEPAEAELADPHSAALGGPSPIELEESNTTTSDGISRIILVVEGNTSERNGSSEPVFSNEEARNYLQGGLLSGCTKVHHDRLIHDVEKLPQDPENLIEEIPFEEATVFHAENIANEAPPTQVISPLEVPILKLAEISPLVQEQSQSPATQKWIESPLLPRQEQQLHQEQLFLSESPFPSHLKLVSSKQPFPQMTRQRWQAIKRAKATKNNLYTRIYNLEEKLKTMTKLKEKYRKRWLREKEKTKVRMNPESKVIKFLGRRKVDDDIFKQLVFNQTLCDQLAESYQKSERKKKQIISNAVLGRIMSESGLIKKCKHFTIKRHRIRISHRKSWKDVVQNFYLDDLHSCLDPNKKHTITRNKIKKQKRYLNLPLQQTYKKFKDIYGPVISYTTFCKFRPFWVVWPKVSARNTCACVKHENANLLVHRLHFYKVISQNHPQKLINDLCCDPITEECLARQCTSCKEKRIELKKRNQDLHQEGWYEQWVSKKEDRVSGRTKKDIVVSLTVKSKIESSLGDMVTALEDTFFDFMDHERVNYHQTFVFKQKKKTLTDSELYLHIDFAENATCKYATEVQSVHYGASRQQITLHTGVVKTENYNQCFVSISESLQHDAIGVITHVFAALDHYLILFPEVDTLHFQSDGPSAQYRNKTIFGLIGYIIPERYPQIKKITWNYSIPGHGKGAADGVGAAVKRIADDKVAHGIDIPDFSKFYEVLTSSTRNIDIFVVSPKDIEETDKNVFKNQNVFSGTMSVYQVTWKRARNYNTLHFNSLSCFVCSPGDQCEHYHKGSLTLPVLPEEDFASHLL